MRSENTGRSHAISGFFVFLLIALFALMSLVLMLIGTRAYQRVADASLSSANGQMITSYLLGKIRAYDQQGHIMLRDMDGTPVLCLGDGLQADDYETRIYFYDGSICEQYAVKDEPLDPELAQPLIQAKSLDMVMETDSLICVTVTQSSGEQSTLHMAIRSQGGLAQ